MSNDCAMEKDINARLQKAASAFGVLHKKLWNRRCIKVNSEYENQSVPCCSRTNIAFWLPVLDTTFQRNEKASSIPSLVLNKIVENIMG